jgi:hypothetical protein
MPEETIACTLTNGERTTRRERWRGLGERGSGGVVETPTGLRLAFRSSPAVEQELRALADLEQECCAFATWTVRKAGPHVVLDVEAAGDAVAAVHGMFATFRTTLAAVRGI